MYFDPPGVGSLPWLLFRDLSSTLNTVLPHRLLSKFSTSVCYWILDFLSGRTQMVNLNNSRSQRWHPTLHAYPCGCAPCPPQQHHHKVCSLRDEVEWLPEWCRGNNLVLNTTKTMEWLIVDFKEKWNGHTTILQLGLSVEGFNIPVSGHSGTAWHSYFFSWDSSRRITSPRNSLWHFTIAPCAACASCTAAE